jgi:hypothetical protein
MLTPGFEGIGLAAVVFAAAAAAPAVAVAVVAVAPVDAAVITLPRFACVVVGEDITA